MLPGGRSAEDPRPTGAAARRRESGRHVCGEPAHRPRFVRRGFERSAFPVGPVWRRRSAGRPNTFTLHRARDLWMPVSRSAKWPDPGLTRRYRIGALVLGGVTRSDVASKSPSRRWKASMGARKGLLVSFETRRQEATGGGAGDGPRRCVRLGRRSPPVRSGKCSSTLVAFTGSALTTSLRHPWAGHPPGADLTVGTRRRDPGREARQPRWLPLQARGSGPVHGKPSSKRHQLTAPVTERGCADSDLRRGRLVQDRLPEARTGAAPAAQWRLCWRPSARSGRTPELATAALPPESRRCTRRRCRSRPSSASSRGPHRRSRSPWPGRTACP